MDGASATLLSGFGQDAQNVFLNLFTRIHSLIQACNHVLTLGGQKILGKQDFCLYYMFETNFSGHNIILVQCSLQGRSQDFSKGGAEVMEAKALKKKNCL